MNTLFKLFFITLLLQSFLHAEENFSEMSTQELLAIMGYVKKDEVTKFRKELKAREPFMNDKERKKYKKHINKSK